MASAAAIGIMREEVHIRLAVVTGELLGAHGLTPRAYTGLSKDPDIAVICTLAAIADDLEALRDAQAEPVEVDERTGLLTAILNGNATEVTARIGNVESVDDLEAIKGIEAARGVKARKSVLAAIEARMAVLVAEAVVTPPADAEAEV